MRELANLILGFSFLVCLGAPLALAGDLDIDAAIHESIEHSSILENVRAQAGEASWKPLEALSSNLPRLSIQANHFTAVKYQEINFVLGGSPTVFPEIYPKTQITLGAYWTIFDGFSTPAAYGAANKLNSAAKNELLRAELEVTEGVRLKFYQALAAQILLDVADQNVKTLEEHLQNTKDTLAKGVSTRFDLLRVEVQLEDASSERAAAADNVVIARKALALAMGDSAEALRPLKGILPIPEESAVPSNINVDISQRDDVTALKLRADAANRTSYSTYGNFLPKITLAAEKQYYNSNSFSLHDKYGDAYSLGVALSWNIFDGGFSLARTREASYAAAQADAKASYAALQAEYEFETWHRKYFYNVKLYSAKKRAIETAEESVRLARLGYNAGSRTNTDVLDAELDLFRARAGLVRAQVEGAEAFINLEFATGKKL